MYLISSKQKVNTTFESRNDPIILMKYPGAIVMVSSIAGPCAVGSISDFNNIQLILQICSFPI